MEFFLIGLPVPLIMVTDYISDFQYNFKHEDLSIPSMAAKLDTTAAIQLRFLTTSFTMLLRKTPHQNVFNK